VSSALLACRSETPLHRAAHYGHATVAAALLSHGVDSNAKESVEG
jgi:ankyrin repeat protein